ncbi:MAG: murein hydrolase activator EnvC family protein [Actinomycetota bacterium]
MPGRLKRAALAGTLLATLVVPAVGSIAGPEQELQRNQDTLATLRERIDDNSAQASSLRDDIDGLNRSITKLQVIIVRLDTKIDAIKSEIRDAEARIADTQKEIDEVEGRAIEQAVELYKGGGTETIDALLDARSISELNDRIEMMGVAAQENHGALVQYSRLKQEIQELNRDLFAKREDLDANLDVQTKAKEKLAHDKAVLAGKLDRVTDKLAQDRDHAADLAAANQQIKSQIVEFQAKAAVAVLGTSNQGFIWPLNGGVTSGYGPRWGSMHTGIDIDGYSGQPIVAAKEGVVITAGSMGGYGNAVVIDHGGGYSTLYAHMSALNTSGGASVGQGDVIGYVGCTGSCTGDHLHFEVRVNGNPVDPMPYLP